MPSFFTLSAHDLFRDRAYRRLWTSILISSFGAQITILALPLTAALLLHASPTQMGFLTFMEIAPFVLLSLPAGVWLDRVRKLPIYVSGELMIASAVASVPLAWWLGWLSMPWLYVVSALIGTVNTAAGTAAQIVLTQIVPRTRLVEAHARNALATSGAEVAGPASAGILIKLLSAPLALFTDAFLLLSSAFILRGIRIEEAPIIPSQTPFWAELRQGLRFALCTPLLARLALTIGIWQMCYHGALVIQILFATRILHMSEHAIGLAYMGMGCGTVLASLLGHRISRKMGPGPCMITGIALCAVGWSAMVWAPQEGLGIAVFVAMLFCFGVGGVLIFINFLALRQAVTPEALLGRMTATMRWLTLLPAGPGALLAGWLGEHLGLRHAFAFSGGCALLLAIYCWRTPLLRQIQRLPNPIEPA